MAAIPPPVNTPWSARRREDRQAQEMMSPTDRMTGHTSRLGHPRCRLPHTD
ncbi:uncharacterized protein B0H18DRAFT_978546 [Fomitopsis serialis]|uniref:uncharacterized protein n=1 Tax=Fomitopsis serialis TaxID=139415 RepID=UPI0020085490|nr:uncharacterized protein B0H18DRAFT_978546 [Neoantrodia serialis]KAH9934839.1 hypothetical protein B0H18DRAFT_978546 [Neoantrodia serialis]